MARDNVTTMIERIRRQLSSTVRLEVNQLGASISLIDSTVTLAHDLADSLREGAMLSIGSELFRVMGVNVAAKEVTVIRGWQDTEPELHPLGAEVLINPRFTRFAIFDAILQEIESWDPDLFRVVYVTLDSTDETQTVQLPALYADAIGVITVRANETARQSSSWPTRDFKLQRGGTDHPEIGDTGLIIRLIENNGFGREGKLHIQLAIPFDTSLITEASNLTADAGVHSSLLELIELGVKARLLADVESNRSQRLAQDEPRRAEEVPPNAAMSVSEAFMQRHARRRSNEVSRLRTRYPLRQW